MICLPLGRQLLLVNSIIFLLFSLCKIFNHYHTILKGRDIVVRTLLELDVEVVAHDSITPRSKEESELNTMIKDSMRLAIHLQ